PPQPLGAARVAAAATRAAAERRQSAATTAVECTDSRAEPEAGPHGACASHAAAGGPGPLRIELHAGAQQPAHGPPRGAARVADRLAARTPGAVRALARACVLALCLQRSLLLHVLARRLRSGLLGLCL